jgi:hypothetical protein
MTEFVYIIIPTRADFVKVGKWNGTVPDLISRYKTYYGVFDFIIFQCHNCSLVERQVLSEMKLYRFNGELFFKDGLYTFVTFMSSLVGTSVFDFIENYNYIYKQERKVKNDLKRKIQQEKQLEKERKTQIKRKKLEDLLEKQKLEIKAQKIQTRKQEIESNKLERTKPFFDFLQLHSEYKKGHIELLENIRLKYNESADVVVGTLDNETFSRVDERYIVESTNICKHCNNQAKKGCCEKFKNIDRTKKKIVRNMVF